MPQRRAKRLVFGIEDVFECFFPTLRSWVFAVRRCCAHGWSGVGHNYGICVDALVKEASECRINGVTRAAIAIRIETHRRIQLFAAEARAGPGLKKISHRSGVT